MGGSGAGQVATHAGPATHGEVSIDTIFLGHLELKSASDISPDHVRDAWAASTGHRCEDVVLISASCAVEAVRTMRGHHVTVTVGAVLDNVYEQAFVSSFGNLEQHEIFTRVFLESFLEMVQNAVRHTFRHPGSWVDGYDRVGETLYHDVYNAVAMAHYYYLGLNRSGVDATFANRLRPLVDLMDHVAVPFALADNNKTLLCLAN